MKKTCEMEPKIEGHGMPNEDSAGPWVGLHLAGLLSPLGLFGVQIQEAPE